MTKLKQWREIIILSAAAVLLLVYIIFRSGGNINYVLPVLPALTGDDVTAITAEGDGVSLRFEKSGGQWKIQPEGWEAAQATLDSIAKTIADLKPVDLISTAGKPEQYDLDEESRITVTAAGGGDVLRKFYAGKVSSAGIYTYVLFPGDDNIYSVRGDLRGRLGADAESFREKEILRLPRGQISRFVLMGADGTSAAVGLKDGVWTGEEGFEADSAAVDSMIPSLSPLRCTDFIDTPAGTPAWILTAETAEGDFTLEIWDKTEDGYPARSSSNGYPVMLTQYTTENVLRVFGLSFGE